MKIRAVLFLKISAFFLYYTFTIYITIIIIIRSVRISLDVCFILVILPLRHRIFFFL